MDRGQTLFKELSAIAPELGYSVAKGRCPHVVICQRFTEKGDRIQVAVYWSEKFSKGGVYTVGTAINHPKQGKTQLFRRDCSIDDVAGILRNPRSHTGRGYYQR